LFLLGRDLDVVKNDAGKVVEIKFDDSDALIHLVYNVIVDLDPCAEDLVLDSDLDNPRPTPITLHTPVPHNFLVLDYLAEIFAKSLAF
jgi:hypothetical protein